jgi:hypothetical protein
MAQLSSPFLLVTDYAAATSTINLAASRAMRVVSIQGTGLNTGVITVSKVNAAGDTVTQMGVVTLATGDLNDFPATMDALANCTLLATDTIRIVGTVANSTRCVLNCMADSGATIVES